MPAPAPESEPAIVIALRMDLIEGAARLSATAALFPGSLGLAPYDVLQDSNAPAHDAHAAALAPLRLAAFALCAFFAH